MKYLITILTLAFLSNVSYAQKEFTPDTTKAENNEVFENVEIEVDTTMNYEDEFDLGGINYGSNYSKKESLPTIDLNYLMVNPSIHKDYFTNKFSKSAGLELKLGYLEKEPNIANEYVFEMSHTFLFLSNLTTDLLNSADLKAGEIKTDIWRFGFGTSSGYGWKLGENSDISLYNSGSIVWSKVDFKDTTLSARDNQKIRDFGDGFRFGTMTEDGIRITPYKPVSITIAYEKSFVFPRTIFWYWVASELTEGIAQGLVSTFIDDIVEKSPTFGPIVNWVLTSGISYGMNLLRAKHMHWPVNTVSPLALENIKASLSFSF